MNVDLRVLLMDRLSDGLHRKNGADLIIHHHHRNQDRLRTDRLLHLFRCDNAFFIYRKAGNLIALLLQEIQSRSDARMLNICRNDMISQASFCQRGTDQCLIIALRSPGGKKDLFRKSVNAFCSPVHSVLQIMLCRYAAAMKG